MQSVLITLVAAGAVAACTGEDPTFTAAVLQDPATCRACHPAHFDEWSASMHAYASEDPVFVAMNKRGQRDTGNALGTFCVQCHAPMAVALHETNGVDFDPAALRPETRGITCYFCHSVEAITDTHNNGLVVDVANTTMHGGADSPVKNRAHHADYQVGMDSDRNSSEMCGSCHDVVTPRGVALERTYSEWQTTYFADPTLPKTHQSCGVCHMPSHADDVIADDPEAHVTSRKHGYHSHLWPAVDQAMLTPTWPGQDVMAAGIQDILQPAIAIASVASPNMAPPGGICVGPMPQVTIRIDSPSLGHAWPSGAAQDRRAWLEVTMYRADQAIVYQSGKVADGVDPGGPADPNLFGFWDRTTKDDGTPAHFFWDVAPGGVDSKLLLRPPISNDRNSPFYDHSSTATILVKDIAVSSIAEIDRVEAHLHIRPYALSVLAELVGSGDLDASFMTAVPTLDAVSSTWTRATMGTGTAIHTPCNPY